MPPRAKGKAKSSKRKIPDVGDYILVNTPVSYLSGTMLEVIDILDRDRVVGRSVALEDNDYRLNQFVVFTKQPRNTKKNPNISGSTFWIKKVVKVIPPAPKPVKPPKPVRVITTRDELTEHLTAPLDNSVHVVVALKEGGVDNDSSDNPAPSALCAAVPPGEASAEAGN